MAAYVIVVANPKGGVGKTTTALLLASVFDHYKLRVTVFDADRQESLHSWKAQNVTKSTFPVIAASDDVKLHKGIKASLDENDLVIVDVAGVKDFLFLRALNLADLVIIPLQMSPLDATRAAETCALVEEQGELLNQLIPYTLLYTKTKVAIRTRLQTDLDANLQQNSVPVLQPPLAEREAYKHMFATGQTIYEMDTMKVSNHMKALENAELLAANVLELTGLQVAPEHRTWTFTDMRHDNPKPSKKKVA